MENLPDAHVSLRPNRVPVTWDRQTPELWFTVHYDVDTVMSYPVLEVTVRPFPSEADRGLEYSIKVDDVVMGRSGTKNVSSFIGPGRGLVGGVQSDVVRVWKDVPSRLGITKQASLRDRVIRLAHANPALRPHLLAALQEKVASPLGLGEIDSGKVRSIEHNGVWAHVWFDAGVAKTDFGHDVPNSGQWEVRVTRSPDPLNLRPRAEQLASREFRYADPRMRDLALDQAEDYVRKALATYSQSGPVAIPQQKEIGEWVLKWNPKYPNKMLVESPDWSDEAVIRGRTIVYDNPHKVPPQIQGAVQRFFRQVR